MLAAEVGAEVVAGLGAFTGEEERVLLELELELSAAARISGATVEVSLLESELLAEQPI